MISTFRRDLRRFREECDHGRSHTQLDPHQHRILWRDGRHHHEVLCSWCGQWAEINKESDLPDSWSPQAKEFWKQKHLR